MPVWIPKNLAIVGDTVLQWFMLVVGYATVLTVYSLVAIVRICINIIMQIYPQMLNKFVVKIGRG